MKHKEDELIELAFGDLKGERAEQLRKACAQNSESAKLLKSYETMREGLQSLKDIPEMQLSSERLSDALLRGGLKQGRPRWNWNLLAWPAAAGLAFAVGMVLFRPGQSEPQLMTDADVKQPLVNMVADLPKPDLKRMPAMSLDPVGQSPYDDPEIENSVDFYQQIASQIKVVPSASTSSNTVVERNAKTAIRPRTKGAAAVPNKKAKVVTSSSETRLASFNAGAAPKPEAETITVAEQPVVVIDPSPTPGRGADLAREVAAENVVVGG